MEGAKPSLFMLLESTKCKEQSYEETRTFAIKNFVIIQVFLSIYYEFNSNLPSINEKD